MMVFANVGLFCNSLHREKVKDILTSFPDKLFLGFAKV